MFSVTDEHLLPFRKGEIIIIKDRDEANQWYVGECDGREGSFPADHVELLPGDTAPTSTVAPAGPTVSAAATHATLQRNRLSLTLRKGVIDEELAKHDSANASPASSPPPLARELPTVPTLRSSDISKFAYAPFYFTPIICAFIYCLLT